MAELEGFVVIDYDISIQTVAIQMVNNVMDTNQVDVRALEEIFEEAVLEARKMLLESIYDDSSGRAS